MRSELNWPRGRDSVPIPALDPISPALSLSVATPLVLPPVQWRRDLQGASAAAAPAERFSWRRLTRASTRRCRRCTVQADLTDPSLDATLKAHKAFPNVRGVRHQLYWESHPLHQIVSRPNLCNTPEFRRGFALLEKYGLHFELQVFASQAKYAAELIKAFPNINFILLHSGMLTNREPMFIEQWREGLALIASFPNAYVKISGLGMFTHGWTYAQMRQVIRDSIQIFGVNRTIYGSNFPLEKLWCSYADLMAVYRKVLS